MTEKNDRNTFMEILHSVKEMVKVQDGPLTKEDILRHFADMELSEDQRENIYQYFLQQKEEYKPDTSKGRDEGLPDTLFFRMYLQDLEKIKPCTKREEEQLYGQLAAGGETAVQELSQQWLPRVLELAKAYAFPKEELADIIQEGNMCILLKLQELLGCGASIDVPKVLREAAKEAMESYMIDIGAAWDIEQSMVAKASLVHEAQIFLAREFYRMPTLEELSQYTKMPEEELADILAMLREKK